ncbi:hypothetical protein PIB30_061754 [Stylosanthes scabra]|uniref:Uncharacterized protein n=1 Tax=Stylosanthes scabra TaxID=79078 RepID=A0ABU6UKF3_9FABA|nr:hypothetical protein [Stylosanthes scabra]
MTTFSSDIGLATLYSAASDEERKHAKAEISQRRKNAKRRNGAIVIRLEQTWTLWKDELNVYNFHVEELQRSKCLGSNSIGKLTSRVSQRYIMVHMKIGIDRAAAPPLLNDEVYDGGRGRVIACCPLHLKAKKGISSQVDAYK